MACDTRFAKMASESKLKNPPFQKFNPTQKWSCIEFGSKHIKRRINNSKDGLNRRKAEKEKNT